VQINQRTKKPQSDCNELTLLALVIIRGQLSGFGEVADRGIGIVPFDQPIFDARKDATIKIKFGVTTLPIPTFLRRFTTPLLIVTFFT
jgi:hypothetical protein